MPLQRRETWKQCALALALAVLVIAPPARAGGPRSVNGLGQPMAWDTAGPIVYNPETGGLGILSNAQARALLAAAFADWSATGVVAFSEGAPIAADVNAAGIPASNPAHWKHFWRVSGDGISPVLFDNDGKIIDGLFGLGARFDILGLATIDTPIGLNTEISEASVVINGLFFDGVGLPGSPQDVVSQVALRGVMVHEIGHYLNLDHSVVNADLAADGLPANDVFVPTMYPMTVTDETAIATLNPDDVAAVRRLYDPGVATNGLGGSVTAGGGVPFQGALVVARDVADPLMNAYGTVSGALYFPCNAGSTCDPCNTACDPGAPPERGAWSIPFVAPGSYTVCVEQIDTRLSVFNGSFIGPLATPPVLPGPHECLAAGESASDDPEDADPQVAGLLTNLDFQLNDLPVGDAFEPNDTFGSASNLPDLPGGRDTAAAVLDGRRGDAALRQGSGAAEGPAGKRRRPGDHGDAGQFV